MSGVAVTAAQIKALYELKARALAARPGYGRSAAQAFVRLGDGLSCEVEQSNGRLRVDLPTDDGGTASALHPGELMRASLGACLALGYRIWAARLEVALDRVEVEVTCEYDARGQLGLDDTVAVGWQQLSVDVVAVSDAPEPEVRRVIETADRYSPMLANLSSEIRRRHRLRVVPPG
jgi:uncharacterized OsmC-like protein